MADAWDILLAGSTDKTGDAWNLLITQGGNGSGGEVVETRSRRVVFYPKGRTETTIEIIKDYTIGS